MVPHVHFCITIKTTTMLASCRQKCATDGCFAWHDLENDVTGHVLRGYGKFCWECFKTTEGRVVKTWWWYQPKNTPVISKKKKKTKGHSRPYGLHWGV